MNSTESLREDRLLGVVAAVWGALLVGAYLLARREILDLPADAARLVAASGSATWIARALARDAAAIASAAAVAAACYGFGRALGRAVRPPARFGRLFGETALFAAGTAIGATLVFVAGHVGALRPPTAFAFTTSGIALLVATLWLDRRDLAEATARVHRRLASDRLLVAALVAIALFGVAPFFAALAPPTARDAVIYHLAAPKAYVAAGALVETPENVHSYLPFDTEMLFTWALLQGPDTGANLVHFVFWCVALAMLFAATRSATKSSRWGLVAAMLFASIPSVAFNAGIAHNEMSMSLYVGLALVALASWATGGSPRDVVWFGIALGCALATKHTALWLGPIAVLAVLYKLYASEPEDRAHTLRWSVLAAGVALAVASPWYVQNFVRTGNPIYPYFWDLFATHHPLWDAERARLFQLYLTSTYGAGSGLLPLVRLPWEVSILAEDNDVRYFDGVLGPAFLLVAPFTLYAFWRLRRAASATAAALAVFVVLGLVIWSGQSQQIRFLLPYLACGAIVAAVALSALRDRRRASRVLAVALALVVAINLLVVAASVVRADPFRVALGLETRGAYLERAMPYFRFYELLERDAAPGDRVFLVDMRNDTYNLDVGAFSDSVLEHYTLTQIVAESRDGDEIAAALGRRGITYLLVGEDILLDPAYTPFDSSQMAKWQSFLGGHARRLAWDGRIALYSLKGRD